MTSRPRHRYTEWLSTASGVAPGDETSQAASVMQAVTQDRRSVPIAAAIGLSEATLAYAVTALSGKSTRREAPDLPPVFCRCEVFSGRNPISPYLSSSVRNRRVLELVNHPLHIDEESTCPM
jgi:hypothetical protein